MSSSRRAWLVPALLGVAALSCAPDGDANRLETKQGAVTAVLFKPYVATPVGSFALGVATGDLNGDGRTDVALTTGSGGGTVNDNSLNVFLQAADGTLQPRVRYPLGKWPQSIDIGDVNGDGRADVVVGNKDSASVGVLLQNTSGTLDPMVTYATARSYAVKVGDFNSDGRMDVASVNWGYAGHGVDIFLQTAAGTLAPPVTYPVIYGGFNGLAVGDVSGDGRTDIVVVSDDASVPNVGVLLQRPDGTMTAPVYHSVGAAAGIGGVGIGDVNGDGLADVVVSYADSARRSFVGRFLQNAQHTLNAVESYASRDKPVPIVLADVDGNGRKDVLTAHVGQVQVGVYRQAAGGELGAEELYPIFSGFQEVPWGLAVGDISGDGLPDVVFADSSLGLAVLRHVDDVPPAVAITAPLSGNVCAGAAVQLTWTASDNAALAGFDVSVSYDGGTTYAPVSGCSGLAATARACTFVPASGAPRLRVAASDTAANKAQAESSITVGPSVQADQASYAPGATISVSYSCLPGNATDWISVAPAGAPSTSVISWVYTGGNKNGTATFAAPGSGGSYVIRAFRNNTLDLLAETPLTVVAPAATVGTNATTYEARDSITVTYANLPGNATDWIAVAPAGSPSASVVSYVFTGGNKNGTATLRAPSSSGSYVIRAFAKNTYELLAEAPFAVTATPPSVSTNAATYEARDSITVTYANLPGNTTDWIAVAPAGSPSTSVVAYVYTGGNRNGTATLAAPASSGSYVIRAFRNNTLDLLAEAPFAVTATPPSVSTNAPSYEARDSITVTYANLPGNTTDWIAVAPAGSPSTSVVAYVYTGGNRNGTATLAAPASAGSYVIRAFRNNTLDLLAEAPFAVTATPPSVSTNAATYEALDSITITYANLPGNATDWIGVAPAGSPSTSVVSYVYTGGNRNGTATLAAPGSAGSYVIRAFRNNTLDLLAEAPFSVTVTPPSVSTNAATYVAGHSITVTYANLPGNATDWIGVAPAGSPSTSVVSYVFTGGNRNGTATLAAPGAAGSYVIRAFRNNTLDLLAEAPFSVIVDP